MRAGDVIMTKNKFKDFSNKTVYCKSCHRIIDVKNVCYRYLHSDGTVERCNFCDWIFRHKGAPNIKGYEEYQIKYILEYIIFEKSLYINELENQLNIPLNDIIHILNVLHIGNKKYMVKAKCDFCNKEVEKPVNVYLKNKHVFCSNNCYHAYRAKTIKTGKDNAFYKRICARCTNCNKDIYVIPYNYNKINKFGDNHNFCSQECYWEYRSKYYIGEKSPTMGIKYTPEIKEKMRKIAFENSRNSSRFNSGIQLKINQVLDKNSIHYSREYVVKYFSFDNYLTEYELFIEVMGDYWHSSPLKYNKDKYMINKIQSRTLLHDKQKHSYIKNHLNKEILYIWENDINNNINLCEKLILEYIGNNGNLKNYNSFNYHMEDDKLVLNNEIIKAYQELNSNVYKHLIKDKGIE